MSLNWAQNLIGGINLICAFSNIDPFVFDLFAIEPQFTFSIDDCYFFFIRSHILGITQKNWFFFFVVVVAFLFLAFFVNRIKLFSTIRRLVWLRAAVIWHYRAYRFIKLATIHALHQMSRETVKAICLSWKWCVCNFILHRIRLQITMIIQITQLLCVTGWQLT